MSGIKKFIESSDKFLEKASKMLDTAIEKEDLKIEEAKEFADLIYRIMQSIKVMNEKPKGKESKFVSKVDQWANESRNGTQ